MTELCRALIVVARRCTAAWVACVVLDRPWMTNPCSQCEACRCPEGMANLCKGWVFSTRCPEGMFVPVGQTGCEGGSCEGASTAAKLAIFAPGSREFSRDLASRCIDLADIVCMHRTWPQTLSRRGDEVCPKRSLIKLISMVTAHLSLQTSLRAAGQRSALQPGHLPAYPDPGADGLSTTSWTRTVASVPICEPSSVEQHSHGTKAPVHTAVASAPRCTGVRAGRDRA